MKAKIISKLAIAQLACLPLISISCGKHEQKVKENLVTVASDPKFDKLIDKNKEDKTDKTTPIVEKIKVVNNGESGSKQIEKSKKVEVKNPNSANSPINIEVKNDIKIDNKINTKENKLKTFFAVVGGLATAAAVGYGIYWLFKDNIYFEIENKSETQQTVSYENKIEKIKVTIEYKRNTDSSNNNSIEVRIKTFKGYIITQQSQQWVQNGSTNNLTGKATIEGTKWYINKIISEFKSEITNKKEITKKNWELLLLAFKDWISNFSSKNAEEKKK